MHCCVHFSDCTQVLLLFLSDLLLAQCTAQGYCTVWPKKKKKRKSLCANDRLMHEILFLQSLLSPRMKEVSVKASRLSGKRAAVQLSPGCSALKSRHSLKLHQDSGQNSHAFFLPYLVPLVPTQNPMPLSCCIPAHNSRKLIH